MTFDEWFKQNKERLDKFDLRYALETAWWDSRFEAIGDEVSQIKQVREQSIEQSL